jgi:hypothetical protein
LAIALHDRERERPVLFPDEQGRPRVALALDPRLLAEGGDEALAPELVGDRIAGAHQPARPVRAGRMRVGHSDTGERGIL